MSTAEPEEPQDTPVTLAEREAMFRNTFEHASVGIAHVGPQGQWLNVNRRVCEIVGYPREELLKISFQDITHPDDLNLDVGLLNEVLEGKRDTYGSRSAIITSPDASSGSRCRSAVSGGRAAKSTISSPSFRTSRKRSGSAGPWPTAKPGSARFRKPILTGS